MMISRPLLFYFLLLPLLSGLALANVEKTIFIAPSLLTIPTFDPTLDDLGLERLSPSNDLLRTKLNASFPTDESAGTDSWFFLENLTPGQRYEVRVCWLATQPTTFDLTTYSLPEILKDQSLLAALSLYSSAHLNTAPPILQQRHASSPQRPSTDPAPSSDSVLFLRIRATADYFSLDKSLMDHVPPVIADVILDPFIGNIFPRSLLSTAAWVTLVACVAVVVARWIAQEFRRAIETVTVSTGDSSGKTKES